MQLAKEKYINKRIKAKNGQWMECIEFFTTKNITVRFEDGTVVYNKYASRFLEGAIGNPNYKKPVESSLLHTRVKALNGQWMECIAYFDKNNITVQFEDGIVVYHKDASAFKRGQIKNPNLCDTRILKNADKYIGLENVSVVGQKMKIVAWRGTKDITVEFEDGTLVVTSLSSFNKGCVNNPNFTYKDRDKQVKKNSVLGLKKKMANGMFATVVEYIDHSNVVIEFEDGVRTKCRLSAFKTGMVSHPNIANGKKHKNKIEREGFEFATVQGLTGVVINYVSTEEVYVKLSTGVEKCTRWTHILNGSVVDMDYKPEIGKHYKSVYGLDTVVTGYKRNKNVTLAFEDGEIVNTSIYTARRGRAIHPKLLIRKNKWFDYSKMQCSYIFSTDTDKYYICKCSKCGFDQILAAKEMLQEHVCEFE